MPITLLDKVQIVPIVMPLDWDTDRTGDYVCLANYEYCTFIAVASPGTAGDDPTFTVRQATAVAGTSVKDLATITEYGLKQAATDLTATGTFTRTAQTAAATVAGNATSAEQAKVYVFEVKASDLDLANGFDCITCNVALAASGGAQYGTIIAILHGARYPQNVNVSAIVD